MESNLGAAEPIRVTLAGALRFSREGLVVSDEAFGGRLLRLVTTMLVVDREAPKSVEALAEELWPAGPPERWRPALRGLVSKFRVLLSDVGVDVEDAVVSVQGRYVVDLPGLVVDVEVAQAQVVRAQSELSRGLPERAEESAGRARAVLSRPILAGIDSPWLDGLRQKVAADHQDCLVALGLARGLRGRADSSRSVLREALKLAPYREDVWRGLMQVEANVGNDAAALQVYEECRSLLADELGVDPSAATQDLHAVILRGIPTPDRAVHAGQQTAIPRRGTGRANGDGVRNPYVGLRAFHRDDADVFFGREAEIQEVVDRLGTHGGVAVVGPSGIGKSSLVRAGVLAALETGALPDSDLWQPVVVRPGPDPVAELARKLAAAQAGSPSVDAGSLEAVITGDVRGLAQVLSVDHGGGRPVWVVVVDQAEELFTIADRGQADRFIDALLAAVAGPRPPVVLVMTLRADFYDRASRHTGLAAFLSRSQFLLSPLQGDGLQLAITGPAQRTGMSLEDGVLGRLVGEAGTDPSGLPLLQHVLWRLWRDSEEVMTLSALERMGGVTGALAEHAEVTWSNLSAPQRRIARAILLRGVVPTVSGATSMPVLRSDMEELGTPEVVGEVIAALVDSRLVTTWRQDTTRRSMLQLSHEALIEAWPRLGGWVDAQRAYLQVAARLATASDQWIAQLRHDDWLLAGRRLDDALDLARAIDLGTVDLMLTSAESALIDASRQAREARRRREAERRANERDARQQAWRRMRVGLALSAADNALDQNPERTLLLCLEVADQVRRHTPEHESDWLRLLHHGLANNLLLGRLPDVGAILTVLPDGRLVTSRDADAQPPRQAMGLGADVRDRHTGGVVEGIDALDKTCPTVADVDGRGTRLAIADTDGRIHVLDVDTLEPIRIIDGPMASIGSVAISPGGSHVAGLWFRDDTRRLLVAEATTGRIVHAPDPVQQPHGSEGFARGHQLDFHPTEPRLLVTTGPRHSILRLLDTTTWATIAEHDLDTAVRHVQHSPDGNDIATAHHFGVSLHDAATLERRHVWRLQAKLPVVGWLPDGCRLVATGRRLRHLVPEDRHPRATPPRHRRQPPLGGWTLDRTLFPVPGTAEVLTGRHSQAGVKRWDLGGDTGTEVARLTAGHGVGSSAVAWSPDGHRLATIHEGSVVIWMVDTWQEHARQRVTDQPTPGGIGVPMIENITWSHDGATILVPGSGGIFAVLDAGTAASVHSHRRPPAFFAGDVDVTHDGRWIATTHGPRIEILDRDYQPVHVFESPQGSSVEAAAFSPDGRWLATTHWPTTTDTPGAQGATVWDWRTQEVFAHIPGVANNLSWAPDGSRLAVSMDGRTIVWDIKRSVVVHELVGQEGWVQDVTHSPDGATIATGGINGDIRLWDASTGRLRHRFTGHHTIRRVRFHPSRPWLALATSPGTVHVWTLDTNELLDIASSRVTRNLTDDERQRFLAEDTTLQPVDEPDMG